MCWCIARQAMKLIKVQQQIVMRYLLTSIKTSSDRSEKINEKSRESGRPTQSEQDRDEYLKWKKAQLKSKLIVHEGQCMPHIASARIHWFSWSCLFWIIKRHCHQSYFSFLFCFVVFFYVVVVIVIIVIVNVLFFFHFLRILHTLQAIFQCVSHCHLFLSRHFRKIEYAALMCNRGMSLFVTDSRLLLFCCVFFFLLFFTRTDTIH